MSNKLFLYFVTIETSSEIIMRTHTHTTLKNFHKQKINKKQNFI